jgi:hypothetical protein
MAGLAGLAGAEPLLAGGVAVLVAVGTARLVRPAPVVGGTLARLSWLIAGAVGGLLVAVAALRLGR